MNNMNIKKYAQQIHETASEKGFWDKPRDLGSLLMLTITELSEAVEAHRKGRYADVTYYNDRLRIVNESLNNTISVERQLEHMKQTKIKAFESCIKDTFEDEIADSVIRLLDLMEGFGMEIKDNVPGLDSLKGEVQNAPTIAATIMKFVNYISEADDMNTKSTDFSLTEGWVNVALHLMIWWCVDRDINLEFHMQEKMWYNSTRERLHGKKY
jgi:hypothetical protein